MKELDSTNLKRILWGLCCPTGPWPVRLEPLQDLQHPCAWWRVEINYDIIAQKSKSLNNEVFTNYILYIIYFCCAFLNSPPSHSASTGRRLQSDGPAVGHHGQAGQSVLPWRQRQTLTRPWETFSNWRVSIDRIFIMAKPNNKFPLGFSWN